MKDFTFFFYNNNDPNTHLHSRHVLIAAFDDVGLLHAVRVLPPSTDRISAGCSVWRTACYFAQGVTSFNVMAAGSYLKIPLYTFIRLRARTIGAVTKQV